MKSFETEIDTRRLRRRSLESALAGAQRLGVTKRGWVAVTLPSRLRAWLLCSTVQQHGGSVRLPRSARGGAWLVHYRFRSESAPAASILGVFSSRLQGGVR